jgi:hypothetical protein
MAAVGVVAGDPAGLAAGEPGGLAVVVCVRCPTVPGQGSNRILIRKGTGSNAGKAEKLHS